MVQTGSVEQPNYYAILDVGPKATRAELREAFLRMKSAFSAGSAALYSLINEDEARAQLAQAEEAFKILNDDVQRRDYDLKMGYIRSGATSDRLFAAEMLGVEKAAYDPHVLKTTRSNLPITKLHASRAGALDLKRRYEEMLQAGDPADGDLYKRLREAADVAEDEMVERTKVSITHVRAIETNRFERLPQAVYVKGFLRAYFRYLDVPDAERLANAFATRLGDWQANKKN